MERREKESLLQGLLKSAHTPKERKNLVERGLFCLLEPISAGRYYVSFLVEEAISPLPFVKKEIGLDLGIAHMITEHLDRQTSSPHFLQKSLKRLRRRQKNLSLKVLASSMPKSKTSVLTFSTSTLPSSFMKTK